jgi:hypothetical protein
VTSGSTLEIYLAALDLRKRVRPTVRRRMLKT